MRWAAFAAASVALFFVTLALADGVRVVAPVSERRGAEAPAAAPGADTVGNLLVLLQMEPAEGRPVAPDFELPLLGRGVFRMSELKGQVVLLNFWATWCPPCRAEMPALEQVHRDLGPRGLAVVAVDYKEKPETVLPYIEERKLTLPIALDESGEVGESRFSLRGLPTTIVVDRRGRVVGRAIGLREWDGAAARALFEALLAEPVAPS